MTTMTNTATSNELTACPVFPAWCAGHHGEGWQPEGDHESRTHEADFGSWTVAESEYRYPTALRASRTSTVTARRLTGRGGRWARASAARSPTIC